MAEELPFIPGYDYRKMLEPDFSVEEYMEEVPRLSVGFKGWQKACPTIKETVYGIR